MLSSQLDPEAIPFAQDHGVADWWSVMTSNNTYHDDGRRTVGKQKTRQIFECLYEKKCGGSDCVHNLRAKRMQAALRANERRVAQANRARVRARGQDGAGDGDGGDPGDGDDDPVDSDNDEEDDEEEDEVDIDAEAAGDEDAAAIALENLRRANPEFDVRASLAQTSISHLRPPPPSWCKLGTEEPCAASHWEEGDLFSLSLWWCRASTFGNENY